MSSAAAHLASALAPIPPLPPSRSPGRPLSSEGLSHRPLRLPHLHGGLRSHRPRSQHRRHPLRWQGVATLRKRHVDDAIFVLPSLTRPSLLRGAVHTVAPWAHSRTLGTARSRRHRRDSITPAHQRSPHRRTTATVAPKAPPLLCNYLTTPNLLVYSASLASCAIPGIFEAVELMAKASRPGCGGCIRPA